MINNKSWIAGFLLIFLPCTLHAMKRTEEQRLVSAPLPMLKGGRLEIRVPPGWHILKRDPAANWKYASYEFSIERDRKKGHREESRSAGDIFRVEALMHALSRAKRQGDLRGQKFQTSSGLQGIFHTETLSATEGSAYLTIPLPSTGSAIILRVIRTTSQLHRHARMIRRLYKSVAFRV